MLSLFTRFLQWGASDTSAFQHEFEDRLAACYSQIRELQATIHEQHARIERLRAEIPWAPLDTFSFFPRLPTEIRHMIWRYALPRPRLVNLIITYKAFDKKTNNRVYWYVHRQDGKVDSADGFPWVYEFGGTPVLLSACRESRGFALTAYECALLPCPPQNSSFVEVIGSRGSTIDTKQYTRRYISPTELTQKRAYFRPSQDTVYLNTETDKILRFLGSARTDELETGNIKSLAIPLACFEKLADQLLGYKAPRWRGLRELILITNEDARYLDSNTGLLVRRGIAEAMEYIAEQMRARQQKDPQMRFPVVKAMTVLMLKEHVQG